MSMLQPTSEGLDERLSNVEGGGREGEGSGGVRDVG